MIYRTITIVQAKRRDGGKLHELEDVKNEQQRRTSNYEPIMYITFSAIFKFRQRTDK